MNIREFKNGDKITRTKPIGDLDKHLVGNLITFWSLHHEEDWRNRIDRQWIYCDIYGSPCIKSLDLKDYDDDNWDYFNPDTDLFREIEKEVYNKQLNSIISMINKAVDNKSKDFIIDLKQRICNELDKNLQ